MSARVTSESARRISDCVTALLREQPFFGSLPLRLPIRADASRETVASDGREIRYSPRWIADTDAHVIETAMARVVLACALKHHTRRGERDPERWQRASQLVTHGLLRDAGFTGGGGTGSSPRLIRSMISAALRRASSVDISTNRPIGARLGRPPGVRAWAT